MHRDRLAIGFGGAAIAVAVLAFAGQAHAIDWTVGAGAGFAPDYEGSDDYTVVPAWVLRANNLYDPNTFVSITGPELRSNLVPHPQFRAGLFGQYVSSRNNIDDNRVEDLNNTDSSVLVGGTVGWDFFPEPTIGLTTALDARADVANGNGWLVTPRVTYNNALPGNALSFTAEASTTWASDDYMEEYFSVQSGPARRTGLDRYNADADFKDFAIKGTVSYAFTERWSTTLAGQYKRMLGDAKDSPVVDDRGDENQFITALTVNFKF